jgi:hypothetical protein
MREMNTPMRDMNLTMGQANSGHAEVSSAVSECLSNLSDTVISQHKSTRLHIYRGITELDCKLTAASIPLVDDNKEKASIRFRSYKVALHKGKKNGEIGEAANN